jgi:membrane-associated phospholipid phosphatase
VNRPLLGVAAASAVAAAALTLWVAGHQVNPEDVTLARDLQGTDWGPLALTFPFFSWIGDAKGFFIEVGIFAAVLLFNRRAWLFAATAALSGGWYVALSHLILRKRPTTDQVLRVTETPGASSYPSGHSMFIVTVTVVLMLCFGYRFLPRWAHWLGWAVVVLVIAANAIARVYTGAHWPTDIAGGILIATAWLAFLLSIRQIHQRVVSASP